MESSVEILKKLKIELPYDTAPWHLPKGMLIPDTVETPIH
jgi:hypothetical protein